MTYFVRNANQTAPGALGKSVVKNRKCQAPYCRKVFKAMPWDTGDKAELCRKHRQEKAELEAEAWAKIKESRDIMTEKTNQEEFLRNYFDTTGKPLAVPPAFAARLRTLGVAGEGETWEEKQ